VLRPGSNRVWRRYVSASHTAIISAYGSLFRYPTHFRSSRLIFTNVTLSYLLACCNSGQGCCGIKCCNTSNGFQCTDNECVAVVRTTLASDIDYPDLDVYSLQTALLALRALQGPLRHPRHPRPRRGPFCLCLFFSLVDHADQYHLAPARGPPQPRQQQVISSTHYWTTINQP